MPKDIGFDHEKNNLFEIKWIENKLLGQDRCQGSVGPYKTADGRTISHQCRNTGSNDDGTLLCWKHLRMKKSDRKFDLFPPSNPGYTNLTLDDLEKYFLKYGVTFLEVAYFSGGYVVNMYGKGHDIHVVGSGVNFKEAFSKCFLELSKGSKSIEELISNSSIGSPEAKAIVNRVIPKVVTHQLRYGHGEPSLRKISSCGLYKGSVYATTMEDVTCKKCRNSYWFGNK
jgi:hypothetical protein